MKEYISVLVNGEEKNRINLEDAKNKKFRHYKGEMTRTLYYEMLKPN